MLRRLFTFVPILLLAGAGLLLFFVNLSGVNKGVVRHWYWSQTDTSGITGANFKTTRWTNYGICDVVGGKNENCIKHHPAYPYSPKDNFGSSSSLPKTFISNRDTYYYLTRFSYAFFLIALVFTVLALIPVVVSCFSLVSSFVSICTISVAFLFDITAACLITAAHTKGKKAFNKDGHHSKLGPTMFGFTWASVACLLISLVWLIFNTGVSSSKKIKESKTEDGKFESRFADTDSESVHGNNGIYNNEPKPYGADQGVNDPANKSTGINFFRINRKKATVDDGDVLSQDRV